MLPWFFFFFFLKLDTSKNGFSMRMVKILLWIILKIAKLRWSLANQKQLLFPWFPVRTVAFLSWWQLHICHGQQLVWKSVWQIPLGNGTGGKVLQSSSVLQILNLLVHRSEDRWKQVGAMGFSLCWLGKCLVLLVHKCLEMEWQLGAAVTAGCLVKGLGWN